MSEQIGFRKSFRGFHKQDVLTYIDTIQQEAYDRLMTVEKRRVEAEEQLEAARAQAEEAKVSREKAEAELAAQKDQLEQLTALAQMYKAEILKLREEAEQADENEELLRANEQIAALEEQIALLKAQNARYAQIVGDVNRIIVEARVVSASYLDAAQRKSTDCLKSLESFLETLKAQTVEAVECSDSRRQLGVEHIDTLLAELKELGQATPSES